MTSIETDPLAAMADELAAADVHAGFAEQRLELARRMLAEGVGTADVALLAGHCRDTVTGGPGAVARVLVSLLVDAAKREPRLADLRAVAGIKRERAAEALRAPGDAPYVPGPGEGEPAEVWSHDRMCRIAWCRVHGDRRPKAEVARELEVQLGTLEAMLARGQALSRSPLADAQKRTKVASPDEAARDHRNQVQEFRERMRSDQRRSEIAAKPRRDLIDRKRLPKELATILGDVRKAGIVDLAPIMRDKTKLAALAELEADGHVLRVGEPDAMQRQAYRAAANDQERAANRAAMRAWCQEDMQRHNSRGAREEGTA